jgi:hypothetical protein
MHETISGKLYIFITPTPYSQIAYIYPLNKPNSMDEIFDWCVGFLVWLSSILGITYNEINVWIFVIIEPIIFLAMLFIIIQQRKKIRLITKGK